MDPNKWKFLSHPGLKFLAIVLLLLVLPATTNISIVNAASAKTVHPFVTFYGFLDNSPPGKAIAFPVIHSEAGGVGTFKNPITFATDKNEFAPGTIVYVPFLKKYFIMEDDCVQCDTDFQTSHKLHIDLWTGGDANSGQDLINCEDSLTRNSAQVIVHPASNLAVNTQPLFHSKTHKCFQP